MTDADLFALLDRLRAVMVSVATGGQRIQEANDAFQMDYRAAADELEARNIENPLPYSDLWQWYGKWSADIHGYAPRRAYVANLFEPLVKAVRSTKGRPIEPTGWERVDRAMQDARQQLARAKTEEQFQTIGLLCREVLISLAQEVHDPVKHLIDPTVRVSPTDFKRLIEAYIAVELGGSAAEDVRKHARSALDLALRLQHLRTAQFRDAAICIEATGAVVSIIAIVSGRRDPIS
jgi:hypothetical protein